MQKSPAERGPFGYFLYIQIKNHHRKSAKWLAAELQELGSPLDDSLIRRWMSGDRVPQEGHEALPKIAQALGCSETEIAKVHKLALEWFKKQKSLQRSRDSHLKSKNSTNLLVKPDEFLTSRYTDNLIDQRNLLRDGEKSIGLEGARSILETVICFLEKLPKPKNLNDEILLMIHGRTATIEEFADDLQPRWYEAVKSALQKGWKVIHGVRLDDDFERIKKLVRGILLLVGHEGKYEPLIFKQKYVFPVAESFMLIPSLNEGIIFYASNQPRYVDSAIYIKDEVQINILRNHFYQLKAEMNPVFCIWKHYSGTISQLKRADQVPGNRIAILKRLADIQRPNNLYNPCSGWAKAHQSAHCLDLEDLREVLKFRQLRQQKLKQHSLNYSCKYIYTRQCIGEFLRTGREASLPGYIAPIEDRIAQISVYQDLLHYPYYEMALSEEAILQAPNISEDMIRATEFPDIIPSFCEILENHLVLMQIPVNRSMNGCPESKWIVIEEPIIVKAFYQYLCDIWETKIPKLRREKLHITRWLDEEKRRLQQL